MKTSYRAWLLIVAACVVLRLSFWGTAAILIGYGIAEYVDHWQGKKARERIFDDVLFGWEPCKDEPDSEQKDALTRVRLAGKDQILAVRIAELLVRMR
jgi:hypothetical protein